MVCFFCMAMSGVVVAVGESDEEEGEVGGE